MQRHERSAQPRAHRRLFIALSFVLLSSKALRVEFASEFVSLILESTAERVDEHADDGFDRRDDHLVEQEGDERRRLGSKPKSCLNQLSGARIKV
jgi:hypothetical protein